MTDWAAFAGFVGVVLGLLLILARASQAALQVGEPPRADDSSDLHRGSDPATVAERTPAEPTAPVGPEGERPDARDGSGGVDPNAAPETPTARDVSDDGSGTTDTVPDALHTDHRHPGSRAYDAGDGRTENWSVAELHWAEQLHATQSTPSSTGLLANVTISQGAFGLVLLVGAWLADVPPAAFGVTAASADLRALGLGVALGVALYAANEVGAATSDRLGLGRSENLRELLAPESAAGWVVLLVVVLPVVAGFEELLFRGALVGALSMGFGLSPWLLAAVSSVAFAVGHGAQGSAGIVVTGLLGFVLAAAFVLTGSLLVVVVAHYLVNALEFVVHEGLGVDWAGGEG